MRFASWENRMKQSVEITLNETVLPFCPHFPQKELKRRGANRAYVLYLRTADRSKRDRFLAIFSGKCA